MKTIIISDLHLGSEFCFKAELERFIQSLPRDVELVLNGDVFDRYGLPLDEDSRRIFEQLRQRAETQPVYWVEGNHDRTLRWRLPAIGSIRMKKHLMRGDDRILIEHGDRFENVLHYARPMTTVIYRIYLLCQRLTGHRMHVAYYAKQWSFLYDSFCSYMKRNAAMAARKAGATAVICGHSHHAEDTTVDGIRYINTGAWTERPVYAVRIENGAITWETIA